MKSLRALRIAPVLLPIVLAAAGACDRPEAVPEPDPDPAVRETGAEAARQLREGLVRRLAAALDSAGPVAAIEVCSRDAMMLTDSIARAAGDGIAVKRTTDRVRNPRNAPDELERQALARFQADLAAGRPLPGYFVQSAGAEGMRYYEPLRTAPLCLQCHGNVDDMDPAVRAVLAERYPQDRAVSYGEGDFRGLIRVTVPVTESPTR